MNRGRAFTLIEMLLAAVLTAVLVGGVMSVASALARDARRTSARTSDAQGADAAFELIRFDLTNASSLVDHELTFTGHGGIERDTFRPNGRLTRVAYRVRKESGLVREQRYLDDAVHPEPWSELVLAGATDVESFLISRDDEAISVRIQFRGRTSVSRMLHK